MEWLRRTSSIEMPCVSPIPFDSDCGYFKRIIRWLFYTRIWRLDKDWYFTLFNGVTILIPKGFQFDGASIPKLFRPLLSPTGILYLPGIIHDYAYKYNQLLVGVVLQKGGEVLTSPYKDKAGKLYWDYIFRRTGHQVCKLYVIPYVTWLVLVLFGFFAWYKHRRSD